MKDSSSIIFIAAPRLLLSLLLICGIIISFTTAIIRPDSKERQIRRQTRKGAPEPRCFQTKDVGGGSGGFSRGRNSQSVLRYYYDAKRLSCLAYDFHGEVRPGKNNFGSLQDCERSCIGLHRVTNNHLGCLLTPKGSNCSTVDYCSPGFECDKTTFSCCNTTLNGELEFSINRLTCGSDESGFVWLNEEDEQPVLTASCADLTCPAGDTCIQLTSSFAHCCKFPERRLERGERRQGAPRPTDSVYPVSRCALPKDPGACDGGRRPNREGIRWYFSKQKGDCLAFYYNGCGGNANSFRNKADCQDSCLPQDGTTCYGGHHRWKLATKSFIGPDCGQLQCPPDYKCTMGAQFASCCNRTHEKLYEDAYAMTCPDGREADGIITGEFWEAYIADNCVDFRCNRGYQCMPINTLFAKCCKASVQTIQGDNTRSLSKRRQPLKDTCPAGEKAVEQGGRLRSCEKPNDCPTWAFCRPGKRSQPGLCCSPPSWWPCLYPYTK